MKKSPDLRAQCPSCGAHDSLAEFTNLSRDFGPKDLSLTVRGLSGFKCNICDEVIYDASSLLKVTSAIDQISNLRNSKIIKHVRKDILHLTQKEAVTLLSGGGHNAFSRYEQGTVSAPKSLMVLVKLLEKKPELIEDIRNLRI